MSNICVLSDGETFMELPGSMILSYESAAELYPDFAVDESVKKATAYFTDHPTFDLFTDHVTLKDSKGHDIQFAVTFRVMARF